MRQTLTAVFEDRDKAQQALAELLAGGYSLADAVLTTVAGYCSAGPGAAPVPAWRERPGAARARLFAGLVGRSDSHILTLSTDSVQEAQRAAKLISALIPGTDVPQPAPPPATRPGMILPHVGQRADTAAETAHRFGYDMHNNERYRNRSWNAANADLKLLWEARGPQQPGWGSSEAAVRLGWASTSPEIDDDSYYRSHWRTRHVGSAPRAGAASDSGSTAPGCAPGITSARSRRDEPTAWANFIDAIRHGWSRTRVGIDMDEADYRLHHDRTYPGTNYDDLAPVYRYGRHLRRRSMFAGRDWDEVEDLVRAEWDGGHREGKRSSTWDEMKAALRAGWDRKTS